MMKLNTPAGSGSEIDWEWALAFGEGNRTEPVVLSEGPLEDLTLQRHSSDTLMLPQRGQRKDLPLSQDLLRSASGIPEVGKSKPNGRTGVGKSASSEWKHLKKQGRSTGRKVQLRLKNSDKFYALMKTYMNKPKECPVHALKLGFMKAGLEVEERMSECYDVLFLLVGGSDDALKDSYVRLRVPASWTGERLSKRRCTTRSSRRCRTTSLTMIQSRRKSFNRFVQKEIPSVSDEPLEESLKHPTIRKAPSRTLRQAKSWAPYLSGKVSVNSPT